MSHEKTGKFCSYKCSNSRTWTESDKLKKQLSAKNSKKVQTENASRIKSTSRNSKYRIRTCSSCKSVITKKHKQICETCKGNYYKYYRPMCEFDFNPIDYPTKFDCTLIEVYGRYSPSNKGNNLGGVSRDHLFSVSDGFKHNVPAEIIKHPANCELKLHIDNQKKRTRSSITLDELYNRIKNF